MGKEDVVVTCRSPISELAIVDIVDILDVSPSNMGRGAAMRLSWQAFADRLSVLAATADADLTNKTEVDRAKASAGGFAGGVYTEGVRRKTHFVSTSILTIDIDGGAPVDAVAAAVAGMRAIVLETFRSTPADRRCRLIFKLVEPVDLATHDAAHEIMRANIREATGAKIDNGAKDCTRLSYWPVRRPGDSYGFVQTFGAELDARALIASEATKKVTPTKAPRPRQRAPEPRASKTDATAPTTAPRYARAALISAIQRVERAAEGERNNTLNAEEVSMIGEFSPAKRRRKFSRTKERKPGTAIRGRA